MAHRPKILCSDVECRFLDSDLDRLNRRGQVTFASEYALETLCQAIVDADILVTSCFASVPAKVITRGTHLKGIVKYGVGVDNIDLACAAKLGIPVANCPDYGSGAIADMAFALLLCLARKLHLLDRTFHEQGWFWPDERFLATNLGGQTLGIIGMGRIGRKMARRAAGFEMRILTCDPYVDAASLHFEPFKAQFVSLETLLIESDFVSLHCVLTPETQGLIGAEQFRLMKNSAIFIDVSRGAILDDAALVAALEQNEIAGAGLDVFAQEPLPQDHPLLAMADRVVLTPHLAWYTSQAAAEQSRQATEAVLALLEGRSPRSVVNGVYLTKA